MLKICKEKNVAEELIQLDLLQDPLPYPAGSFEHAVCNARFHMLENPFPVFNETSRVLKRSGIFGFTIDEMLTGKKGSYRKARIDGVFSDKHSESGLNMYKHTDEFINKICEETGFEILKKNNYLAFCGKENADDFHFTAYITKKK